MKELAVVAIAPSSEHRWRRILLLKVVLAMASAIAPATLLEAAAQASATTVSANDNQRAAGTLIGRELSLTLEARQGNWRPEGAEGPELSVAAFSEETGPLLTPGPLIRVLEGTTIVVRVRNALTEPLVVHGLTTRPAKLGAPVGVPPGMTREVRFLAGAPGTYHYWATVAGRRSIEDRQPFESQLGGALIIDGAGARRDDRVFVMSDWRELGASRQQRKEVWTINGRSWPTTERLSEVVGRPVRWRWVNLTTARHPMHLHGFFFSVTGIGNGLTHQALGRSARSVVTENMAEGGTMEMRWTPERGGNWLMHCHRDDHIMPGLRFWQSDPGAGAHTGHDPAQAMAGLVLGITVRGDARPIAGRAPEKQITLTMLRRERHFGDASAYAFAMNAGNAEPKADDVQVPGPPLILTRGQPVAITLQNRLGEPTAIHWHGIELDSYYDGVPGFSGNGVSTTPAIQDGEEWTVRFTPPRAGTFIYHTHFHDDHQLASGLYGPIVVLNPGEMFDPTIDHILVFGGNGPLDPRRPESRPGINGGRPVSLKAGVPNRLRFINITGAAFTTISLSSNGSVVRWQPVAKDGSDLPREQRKLAAAIQALSPGETYDFVVTPGFGDRLLLTMLSNDKRQVPITVVR